MVERLLSLPQALSSASWARREVRDLLAPLGVADDEVDTVQAVASELVANGVLHGASEVEFAVGAADRTVRVAVVDFGDGEPIPLDPPSDADHGRGLLVVSRLANRWGVLHREGCKTVWAELELREPIAAAG